MWSAALLLSKEPPASPNHTAGTPPGHVIKARFNMPPPPTPTHPNARAILCNKHKHKTQFAATFAAACCFFVCVCAFFFLFVLGWCSGATYPPPLPSPPTPSSPPLNDKCSPDRRSVQIESRMNEGGGAAQTVGRPPLSPRHFLLRTVMWLPPLPRQHTHTRPLSRCHMSLFS